MPKEILRGGTAIGEVTYDVKEKGQMVKKTAQFSARVDNIEFEDCVRVDGIARTNNNAPITLYLKEVPVNVEDEAREHFIVGKNITYDDGGRVEYLVISQKGPTKYILGNPI